MSFRCSTSPVVAAALALLTAACGSGTSAPNTSTVDVPRATATPITQATVDQQEATREAPIGEPTAPVDSALSVPVRLVKVFDGDSGIAADSQGEFEFRLYGIDAPERDDISRDALNRLISEFGNDLYAEDRDVDIYGRRVILLRTQDGSRVVNLEMVRRGYAEPYIVYGELEGVFDAAAEARADQRGVWGPTPTATPKVGLTSRQEEILGSVRRSSSLTNQRLWQLTYEFINEGRSGSYDDGYAVGYADGSNCDALLLLAQRLMNSSHPALGDNVLAVVVDYFGERSASAYAEGYVDGYRGGRGCTPWNDISPHTQLSATEEGRLEVHGNALAASSMYNRANQSVQQFLHHLFGALNAEYVATAILNPNADGPTFRDYAHSHLGGEGLRDRAWWKNTFDSLRNTYSNPSTRLSGSQQAALDEFHDQALHLYTQALEACWPGMRGYIPDHVDRTYRAARDSNPAIGPWEFVSQQEHPCPS